MIYKIPIKNQYFLDNFFFDFIEKILNIKGLINLVKIIDFLK